MLQSQLLAKTKREIGKDIEPEGYRFLVRGDFVEQLAAGIFSFLPLGLRVLKKIEDMIREEMDNIGGQEVLLPSLQPKEIWQKTDRWDHMDPPLFRVRDRHEKDFALGSTHEEVITKIAAQRIQSWRDLPLSLYQIQNKFRNEFRSTGGLLRNREFLMKDLYSFHADEQDLNNYFERVGESYQKIFKRCQLKVRASQASGGTISDSRALTLEFQVESDVGEDKIVLCQKCGWAANLEVAVKKRGEKCPNCKSPLEEKSSIELGHIFCLGDKYAKAFDLQYVDKQGKKRYVVMGCYGIGLGRLLGTIAEIYHDKQGLIWPESVAPFKAHLVPIERGKKEVRKKAETLYQTIKEQGIEILYDDREEKSAGEKFAEADLIGIPLRIVVSARTLASNSIEIKARGGKEAKLVKLRGLPQFLKSKCKNQGKIPTPPYPSPS